MALKLKTHRWHGSCPIHKRYNPEIHGQSGIRGGCAFCDRLLDIYRFGVTGLQKQIKEFEWMVQNRKTKSAEQPKAEA